MSDTVIVLAGLSVGTYVLKAAGPLLLGGRRLPPSVDRLAAQLPAALLAALIVVNTVGGDRALVVDARLAGVAAAALALWRRLPFFVVVLIAVAVTAAARNLS